MSYPKNLASFYSTLMKEGVKQTNQFQLTISNTGIDQVDKAFEDISMWAKGASVPGRSQNYSELKYLGYPIPIPTNMKMTQEMTLKISADANLKIRDAMLIWMSTISDSDIEGGSTTGGVKTLGTAVARLDLFDQTMTNITHTFRLVGVSPEDVGPMEMSNEDPKIAEFDIKFRYAFWLRGYISKYLIINNLWIGFLPR